MAPTENSQNTESEDDRIDREDEENYACLFFPGSQASIEAQEWADEKRLAAQQLIEEQVRAAQKE